MKKIAYLALIFMFLTGISYAEKAAETVKFDGDVSVTIMKSGKPAEVKISLDPGKNLTDKGMLGRISASAGKASVTWRDVGRLEADMITRDKFSELVIDNRWAKRVNNLINLVESKYGAPPSLDSALSSLGIPKERPTGGEYTYIPGPNNNPAKRSRVTYRDANLNTYLDPADKIAETEADIKIPETIDASRSK